MKKLLVVATAFFLASCEPSPDVSGPEQVGTSTPNVAEETVKSSGGDPCSLLDDPDALFAQDVTAYLVTMPNDTHACEWKNAEQMMCGSITVFGPGWDEVPDVPANYTAMTESMSFFGDVAPLDGVGIEAKAVDGGILGAQIAFRTSKVAALVASACNSGTESKVMLAEKLARAAAERLQ
jgi:hypothetical protein